MRDLVITFLGERIEELEREVAALQELDGRADSLQNEVNALQWENERLREDAARYRWLRDAAFDGDFEVLVVSRQCRVSHLQLDTAIDAARRK